MKEQHPAPPADTGAVGAMAPVCIQGRFDPGSVPADSKHERISVYCRKPIWAQQPEQQCAKPGEGR